jgi:hypothetical protein
MKTSKKWLCWSSLALGGLISLLLSFWGAFGMLWGGFPHKDQSNFGMLILLPNLLALPIFVLAVGVSKHALWALWVLAPIPWLAVISGAFHGFQPGPIGFLKSVIVCGYPSWYLFFLCGLVQFGTQFYELTHDSKWVRWKEASHGPAA